MKYLRGIILILFLLILIENRAVFAEQFNPEPEIPSDIKGLAERLHSEDPLIRGEALRELSIKGEQAKTALPLLIELLADTSSIIWRKDGKVISSSIDKEALQAIINIDTPTVEPLIKALKSNNVHLRRNVAEALGKIKEPRAVNALIDALNDEDTFVRKNSAEALGEIGDKRAFIPLITALNDKKTCVRDASLDALKKVINKMKDVDGVDSLSDFITHENPAIREIVIDAIKGEKSKKAIEILILATKDIDPKIRKKAVDAIINIGKPAIEPLINAMNTEDIDMKISSAFLLGELKASEGIELLINSLKYASEEKPLSAERLRIESAIALGKIADVRAIEPLIEIIRDGEIRLQEAVINALSKIGEPVVEPLISIIKSKDENMTAKINAAIILGNIGDKRAVEPIINKLLIDSYDNKSWMFRAEAIKALGKIKDPRAVEPLKKIGLNDYVSYVRSLAEWAINEIEGGK